MSSFHTAHATWYLDVSLVSQNQGGNYSTIRVTFYAVADSGWSGNASGIGFTVNTYGNGSYSFNGASLTVYDGYYNVAHDANGYASFTASAHTNATGTSTYGGPVDLAQGITLPRIPKVPGAPSLTVNAPVGRNVTINIGIPAGYDEGGSSVQYLWSMYQKDGGAWTGGTSGGWGNRTYSNLAPGVYKFRALAHNAIGDGPYTTQASTVTVRSGGKVWNGTAWVPAAAKVWNGTAWVDATLKVWTGSTWAPVL